MTFNGRYNGLFNRPQSAGGLVRPHESVLYTLGNGYLQPGNVPELTLTHTSPVTFAFWMKTADAGVNRMFFTKRLGAGTLRGYTIYANSGQLWFDWISTWAGNAAQARTTATFNTGAWVHVALVKTAGTSVASFTAYFDAVPAALTPLKDTLSGTISSSAPAQIGALLGVLPYVGNVGDASVYNAALSAGNIATLHNGAAFYDQTTGPLAANLVALWEPATRVGTTVTDLSPSGNDAAAAGGLAGGDFVADNPYP